jgi:tetratricopeptide (TPR) repeat protein
MNDKLNVRFLFVLLISAGVLVGGWTVVHAFQMRRNAGALLAYAERAEEAGQLDRATKLLGLYLEQQPDRVDIRARYGWLLDRQALSPQDRRRTIEVFEAVLDSDSSQSDVRRRVVDLAIELGQMEAAARHLDVLRQAFPGDGDLAFRLGQCREARGDYEAAAGLYGEAVRLKPSNLAAARELARLLRHRLDKPGEADAALDAMVAANRGNFQAYLIRARSCQQSGNLAKADADVAEAMRLGPDEVDPRLLAADLAVRLNRNPDVARGHLRFVIARRPDEPRVYEALAGVELGEGKTDAALAALRDGLKQIPDHPNLLWNEANLLISAGRAEEARPILKKIPAGALPFGRLEYLRAYLLVRDGCWREAIDVLAAIRPALSAEPTLATQADLLLAQCLRTIGDDDRAVRAYRRVIETDPTNSTARFGIVLALLDQGRPDAALTECEALMQMPVAPESGWALLSRLLILQNLRLPPAQRRWERVDSALGRTVKAQPDSPLVQVLRAEAEFARGKVDAARRLLEAARDKKPQESDYRVALFELADRSGDRDRAASLLDEAAGRLGDRVVLRLARARHFARLGDARSLQSIESLADHSDAFSADDRGQLLTGLSDLLGNAGRVPAALVLAKRAVELDPRSLRLRLAVFDLALRAGDNDTMGETLEAMRQIEGSDGALTRYNQARRLLAAAKSGDKAVAAEARTLLTDVGTKRPAWARVPLAIARTYELEGNADKAIEYYLKAIDLGERQLPVVRLVIEMLVERGRYVEADQVIRKLPAQTPLFANLQRLAAEVSLQTKDSSRALEYARKAVPEDSKEPRDQRWLGHVLWATGQNERAERALRRSVELAGADAAGWVALVQFYARTQQNDKASAAIRQAESRIDKAAAPLALAQCYAAVGRLEEARGYFELARKARPDDVVVLQGVADFALRTGRREQAKTALRRIIAQQVKDPQAAEHAQKLLAVLLAAGGSYQESREALSLIGVLKSGHGHPLPDGTDPDDRRTRAVVLATQPRKSQQQEAIHILEGLEQPGHVIGGEDQFLLAQLYERVGEPAKSRDRMLRLLSTEGENARYLAYQVRSLLRQGLLNDAQLWLEKLEQVAPDAVPTIELKARTLSARGQGAEAVEVLRTRVRISDPDLTLEIGGLLEELGQPAAAEEYYRRYAEQAAKSDGALELARFLARRQRLPEALQVCEAARATAAPEPFGYACLAVLRAGKAGDEACRRVEGWLEEAVRKDPAAGGLAVCLADLSDLRRLYPQAEVLYRRVLQRDPRNVVALNNLAWQLALRQQSPAEALSLAELALEIEGPQPALLDTRALALMANGRPVAAIADLEDAAVPTLERPTLASIRFHLAHAYLLNGQHPQAIKAVREAREAGLEEADLHPLEVATFRELATLH